MPTVVLIQHRSLEGRILTRTMATQSWGSSQHTVGLLSEYKKASTDSYLLLGLSKLGNVLHTKHLQRRLDSQDVPIICVTLHPGAVMTPNVSKFVNERTPLFRPLLNRVAAAVLISTRQGAMNSAYAATSPEVKAKAAKFKGAYLTPVGVLVDASPQGRDERLMDELYDTTLEILKELGM